MQKGKVRDFLLWTFLAIILGLAVSFAFLPLLGVNPVESLVTHSLLPSFSL